MSYHINQHQFPSKQVYLNSKYADAYGGVASCKSWCFFNFKEPIVNLPQAYEFLISLNSCEIPLSFPIVNANNNSFTVNVSAYAGGDNTIVNYSYTVVVATGNYSAKDICDAINNNDEGSVGNVIATYLGTLNRFQFTLALSAGVTYDSVINFSISSGNSNPIFGLSGANLTTSTKLADGTFVLKSDVGVDLSGTRAVFIKCLSIHTAGYDSRTKYSSTILARIPLTQEPLSIQWYSNVTQFKAKCVIKNISNLEMQICDEDGNLVDFNTLDWTCTLQLDVIAQSPTDFTPDVPFQ